MDTDPSSCLAAKEFEIIRNTVVQEMTNKIKSSLEFGVYILTLKLCFKTENSKLYVVFLLLKTVYKGTENVFFPRPTL